MTAIDDLPPYSWDWNPANSDQMPLGAMAWRPELVVGTFVDVHAFLKDELSVNGLLMQPRKQIADLRVNADHLILFTHLSRKLGSSQFGQLAEIIARVIKQIWRQRAYLPGWVLQDRTPAGDRPWEVPDWNHGVTMARAARALLTHDPACVEGHEMLTLLDQSAVDGEIPMYLTPAGEARWVDRNGEIRLSLPSRDELPHNQSGFAPLRLARPAPDPYDVGKLVPRRASARPSGGIWDLDRLDHNLLAYAAMLRDADGPAEAHLAMVYLHGVADELEEKAPHWPLKILQDGTRIGRVEDHVVPTDQTALMGAGSSIVRSLEAASATVELMGQDHRRFSRLQLQRVERLEEARGGRGYFPWYG